MLELFANLNSGIFVKSPTNPTEFILPAFYAGQNVNVRYHTLQPTFNPNSPFTETNASNIIIALTVTNGLQIRTALSPVGGQQYLQGQLAIPSGTNLMPANSIFTDLFFGSEVLINGDIVFMDVNATLKIPTI